MAAKQTKRRKTPARAKGPDVALPCEGTSGATTWGEPQVTEEGAETSARAAARSVGADNCAEKKCAGGKGCGYTETGIEILTTEPFEEDDEGGVKLWISQAKTSGRCACR